MRPRDDGRLERGQKVSRSLTAKAWNRVQDAADEVDRQRLTLSGASVGVPRLPCVEVLLPRKLSFGQVARFVTSTGKIQGSSVLPVAVSDLVDFTDAASMADRSPEEQAIINWSGFDVTPGASLATYPEPASQETGPERVHSPFAVCLADDSNRFAISGLAIVRMQVSNYRHRFARVPISGAVLESCFFGPAAVLGYAAVVQRDFGQPAALTFRHVSVLSPNTLSWPDVDNRWALIKF
jgi:hypothetical protein